MACVCTRPTASRFEQQAAEQQLLLNLEMLFGVDRAGNLTNQNFLRKEPGLKIWIHSQETENPQIFCAFLGKLRPPSFVFLEKYLIGEAEIWRKMMLFLLTFLW